jgi:hypothetical protein
VPGEARPALDLVPGAREELLDLLEEEVDALVGTHRRDLPGEILEHVPEEDAPSAWLVVGGIPEASGLCRIRTTGVPYRMRSRIVAANAVGSRSLPPAT